MFNIKILKSKERLFNEWLKSLRDKSPSYYKLFKEIYNRRISNDDFKWVYFMLKSNKEYVYYLPKSPLAYKNLNSLKSDISIYICTAKGKSVMYESNNVKTKFINRLSKDDKRKLLHSFIYGNRINFYLYDDVMKYLKKNNIKYDYSIDNSMSRLIDIAKSTKGIKIVYNKDRIVILKVSNHNAMRAVGTKKWCITRDKETFKDYVGKKEKQYVVFDFNIFHTHSNHNVAFTLKKNGKVSHKYNMHNDEMERYEIIDYLDIIEVKKLKKHIKR